jgi:hypothetical protein
VDKRTRYETTEKGKEARARSRAKQQEKRDAVREERAVAFKAERVARFEAARLAGLMQPKNGTPQASAIDLTEDERKERRAQRLLWMFKPLTMRGECRGVIRELLKATPTYLDNVLARLAKDYCSAKPSSQWLSYCADEEDVRLEVFHEGRSAFVAKFGREFAKYLIEERRFTKRQREKDLTKCLCQMLDVHWNGTTVVS